MRVHILIILLLIITGCSTHEWKEYKTLNGLKLTQAVFETTTFQNDSISLDTFNVSIKHGNVLFCYINDLNEDRKAKFFEYHQPFQIDGEGEKIFRITILNYDLLGDTISFFEKMDMRIGETKIFENDGKKLEVLRQPRWIFTKSKEPNIMEYYTKNYGLILSLYSEKKVRFKRFLKDEKVNDIGWLIEAIEADGDFFTLK